MRQEGSSVYVQVSDLPTIRSNEVQIGNSTAFEIPSEHNTGVHLLVIAEVQFTKTMIGAESSVAPGWWLHRAQPFTFFDPLLTNRYAADRNRCKCRSRVSQCHDRNAWIGK